MAAATEPPITIYFQGFATGGELWGATQADFQIEVHGRYSKEAAVFLNDPAAAMIATELGVENDTAFRERAARAAGQAALTELVDSGEPFDSALVVSAAYLREHPAVLSAAKAALAG